MNENANQPESESESANEENAETIRNIQTDSNLNDSDSDSGEVPQNQNEELPKQEELLQEIEDPQLFSTHYITDDYVITLMHDLTLGDFLIATLLCVLIVVQVLQAVLGGGRR